mmetsp:Transcript_10507/g.14734  ORF Transcript_10507/g.14734 Transcript_10507/m.14734 type:complete len:212 (-) Transcript_10507:66-701(-)
MNLHLKKRLVEKKGLNDSTSDGDHGKAAVDNLLFLTVLDLFLSHVVKSTECPADITGGSITVELVEGGKFDNSNGEQDLHVSNISNLGNGGERVSLSELGPRDVNTRLLDNHTNDGKHGNTSVLKLGPTSIVEVLLDLREAHGVKTHISGHGSVEFLWPGEERDGLRHFCVKCNRCLGRSGCRGKGGGRGRKGSKADSSEHHFFLLTSNEM